MLKRLRKEDGASAVEFALLCPLFFMLIFGIITFGIAFMELQTARGAVREGARTAAVMRNDGTRADRLAIEKATRDASSGLIADGDSINVSECAGPSGVATVSYDVGQVNNGAGVQANLIFFTVNLTPNSPVSAEFMCEG